MQAGSMQPSGTIKMEKRAVVDQIEIARNGTVMIRIAKEIVDGEHVLARTWHRTVIAPGQDVDAQMAEVNRHLTEGLNAGAVGADDIGRVKAIAAVAWT